MSAGSQCADLQQCSAASAAGAGDGRDGAAGGTPSGRDLSASCSSWSSAPSHLQAMRVGSRPAGQPQPSAAVSAASALSSGGAVSRVSAPSARAEHSAVAVLPSRPSSPSRLRAMRVGCSTAVQPQCPAAVSSVSAVSPAGAGRSVLAPGAVSGWPSRLAGPAALALPPAVSVPISTCEATVSSTGHGGVSSSDRLPPSPYLATPAADPVPAPTPVPVPAPPAAPSLAVMPFVPLASLPAGTLSSPPPPPVPAAASDASSSNGSSASRRSRSRSPTDGARRPHRAGAAERAEWNFRRGAGAFHKDQCGSGLAAGSKRARQRVRSYVLVCQQVGCGAIVDRHRARLAARAAGRTYFIAGDGCAGPICSSRFDNTRFRRNQVCMCTPPPHPHPSSPTTATPAATTTTTYSYYYYYCHYYY